MSPVTAPAATMADEMISEALHVRQRAIRLSERVQHTPIKYDDLEIDALRTFLESTVVTISELLCFMAENDLTSPVAPASPSVCAN